MSAVTADDIKGLIIVTIGDVDPVTGDPPSPASAGIVAQNIDLLWTLYAPAAQANAALARLYIERDGLAMVLAVLRRRVDTTLDAETIKRSQQATAVAHRLQQLGEQIVLTEKQSAAGGTPLGGPITRLAPQTPEELQQALAESATNFPDPNDPALFGSPYARGTRRRF